MGVQAPGHSLSKFSRGGCSCASHLVIACAEAMADAWHPAGNNVRLFIRHCTNFGCD